VVAGRRVSNVLHGWELVIVVLLVLLLFGSKKIPELGKGLGEGIRSFKEGLAAAEETEKKTVSESKETKEEVAGEEEDPKLLP
jgi:sec-independent protein translocase protein TatA